MYRGSLPDASNRATYSQSFQLFDDEDDEGIDLTGATIRVDVRKPGSSPVELSVTNNDGIVLTDVASGRFELTFSADQMRSLCPMTYDVGITIEQNGEIIQYIIGTLPVLDGIMSS